MKLCITYSLPSIVMCLHNALLSADSCVQIGHHALARRAHVSRISWRRSTAMMSDDSAGWKKLLASRTALYGLGPTPGEDW
jgi:hypothetical protein